MSNPPAKLSALIVGVGSIGERHLRCFQTSGYYSVAGCEQNPSLATTISQRYGCRVYASLEEALADASFDLAVICTLADSHIPLATTCIQNGLHVLIEKPLALSLEGIPNLEKLARDNDKIVRVAYTTRAMPLASDFKEMASSGKIGVIRHAASVSGQHFPTYRPAYRSIYYRSHETGGGAVQDALTHLLHTMEWLAGPIKRVFASAAHQVLPDVEVEDTVNVAATSETGALISFSFNQFQAPNETFVQLNGTLGSLRWEFHRQRIGFFLMGESHWTWTEAGPEERDGAYIRQAHYFREELNGKPTPLATLSEGLQTLKVNRAVLESANTHSEITIP